MNNLEEKMRIIAERFPIFWYHAYMVNQSGKLKEFVDGIIKECWHCFNGSQQRKLEELCD